MSYTLLPTKDDRSTGKRKVYKTHSIHCYDCREGSSSTDMIDDTLRLYARHVDQEEEDEYLLWGFDCTDENFKKIKTKLKRLDLEYDGYDEMPYKSRDQSQ